MRDKLFDLLIESNHLMTLCVGNRRAGYWHFCYAVVSEHHFCIMNLKDKITFQRTVTLPRTDAGTGVTDYYTAEEIFTAEEILQRDDFGKDIKDFVIFNLELFV